MSQPYNVTSCSTVDDMRAVHTLKPKWRRFITQMNRITVSTMYLALTSRAKNAKNYAETHNLSFEDRYSLLAAIRKAERLFILTEIRRGIDSYKSMILQQVIWTEAETPLSDDSDYQPRSRAPETVERFLLDLVATYDDIKNQSVRSNNYRNDILLKIEMLCEDLKIFCEGKTTEYATSEYLDQCRNENLIFCCLPDWYNWRKYSQGRCDEDCAWLFACRSPTQRRFEQVVEYFINNYENKPGMELIRFLQAHSDSRKLENIEFLLPHLLLELGTMHKISKKRSKRIT